MSCILSIQLCYYTATDPVWLLWTLKNMGKRKKSQQTRTVCLRTGTCCASKSKFTVHYLCGVGGGGGGGLFCALHMNFNSFIYSVVTDQSPRQLTVLIQSPKTSSVDHWKGNTHCVKHAYFLVIGVHNVHLGTYCAWCILTTAATATTTTTTTNVSAGPFKQRKGHSVSKYVKTKYDNDCYRSKTKTKHIKGF